MFKQRLINIISGCVLFTLIALGFSWYLKHREKNDELKKIHRPIDSAISINNDQKKEVPQVENSLLIPIFRYRDQNKNWQVSVGKPPPQKNETKEMGMLHKEKIVNEVETPIFLCSMTIKDSKATYLDLNPNCPAGSPENSGDALGFVSKLIRTGYFFAVRCRSPKHGMYISLNSRCESPEDSFSDFLGAIRASAINNP